MEDKKEIILSSEDYNVLVYKIHCDLGEPEVDDYGYPVLAKLVTMYRFIPKVSQVS